MFREGMKIEKLPRTCGSLSRVRLFGVEGFCGLHGMLVHERDSIISRKLLVTNKGGNGRVEGPDFVFLHSPM